MNKKITNTPLLILGLLAITFITFSCDKDKVESPELPPSEALFIDFSDFSDPTDTLTSRKFSGSYYNWGVAFANVAFWNATVGKELAVPSLAYAEALKSDPVYLGDQQWEWRYGITVNQIAFIVSLKTWRISNEEFMAALFISRSGQGGYNDFKWFEGTVRYDHTKATWTIYEQPSSPVEIFRVEWNYDWEEERGDITYSRIANPEFGSYIKYISDASKFYNASYEISISTGRTEIEWNKASREGRIKSARWFKHENWNCWDQYLMNTICQ